MAYDDKDMTKEVKSLASRFPKRGIDPTIPEDVRNQLRDMEREEKLKEGEAAHRTRKLAKGGKVRGDGICQRGHTKGKML